MDIADLQLWIEQNPLLAFLGILGISILIFLIARGIIARGLVYLAKRSDTQYDDIIVRELHPFRVAWLAPLIVLYSFAYLIPEFQLTIEKVALFLILWVVAFTFNSLLDAVNQVYESSPSFTGVSIQGYLDLVKILGILVAIILSISLFTEQSPIVLLTGLGALTAVLLLIFRDTILSIVASIQITAHDLVKEGDWIEVPSFGVDGDVINMTLHSIKVQNFDKTISVVPTHKMVEVPYKNWRGMQESGGRRIKRSIYIDLLTIKFCDPEMIERFSKNKLVRDYLDTWQKDSASVDPVSAGNEVDPLSTDALTNIGIFRAYINGYLREHESIHKENMSFLVRSLAPGPTGLPIEIYAFSNTIVWAEYEMIQADILDHLLASVSYFDLRVFQQRTGSAH
ncbi:MAG: mechanosensitive ion channel [Anaerolineales bacterium]|nr:mechanosensitive ion channel [Anaerolineales bacterium]